MHDNDEYVNEKDSDATFSVGQAVFTLKDFLRPFTNELKLRSDVFPKKRDVVDQTMNLDLNRTARRNEKAMEKFSPYLINSTYAVIQCNLSYPIGSFNETDEMAELERQMLAKLEEEKEGTGTAVPKSVMSGAPTDFASRPLTKGSARSKQPADNEDALD